MKRYVKSSYEEDFNAELARLTNARERVQFLMDVLENGNVSEHTICTHFFDYLPMDTIAEVLEDLVRECELDEEFE